MNTKYLADVETMLLEKHLVEYNIQLSVGTTYSLYMNLWISRTLKPGTDYFKSFLVVYNEFEGRFDPGYNESLQQAPL